MLGAPEMLSIVPRVGWLLAVQQDALAKIGSRLAPKIGPGRRGRRELRTCAIDPRWVMCHTTLVSAVPGRLCSPRWPRQTCGARSSPAFCVSPVSACPAVSGLQIGLQTCY